MKVGRQLPVRQGRKGDQFGSEAGQQLQIFRVVETKSLVPGDPQAHRGRQSPAGAGSSGSVSDGSAANSPSRSRWDEALRSPDELAAVIGGDAAALERQGAFAVTQFPERGRLPTLPPIAMLLVALCVAGALAPVAVFVASATRLSAARREQRLAALRLVGATPLQTARLAAVEAFVAAALGTIVGVGLFFLVRPLVAMIPLDEATWFAASIAPPLLPAVALVVLVPVVAVGAALFSLRRLVVSPLGVQRRVAPPQPGPRRLAVLGASLMALVGMLAFYRGSGGADEVGLFVIAGAFAGVIAGIAVAGPWLTAIVGRTLRRMPTGGASLLAASRLADDPRGSFGSIAGVIMAIFVATTFLTFSATARAQARAIDVGARPGTVAAYLPAGAGAAGASLADRLVRVQGISSAVAIRPVQVSRGSDIVTGWIVSCPDLLAVLPPSDAACGPGRVHEATTAVLPAGSYDVASDTADPNGGQPPGARLVVEASDIDALIPAGGPVVPDLPDVIIEPSALGPAARTFPATRLYVATDGSPAAVERVRTAIVSTAPASLVQLAGERIAAMPVYDEIGRVVILGLIGTMVLGGCSLAVAVTTAVADRRRQLVFLRSAGMSVASLRAVILLQAGAPLVTVAAFSAGLAVLVTRAILAIAGIEAQPGPDAGALGILVAGVGVALLVVAATLPGLDRMTRPETLRVE